MGLNQLSTFSAQWWSVRQRPEFVSLTRSCERLDGWMGPLQMEGLMHWRHREVRVMLLS